MVFAAGQSHATVAVGIDNNAAAEPDETFALYLIDIRSFGLSQGQIV